MKVHDIVKLNPEIFPADKRFTPNFQAGNLNYQAKMLMWSFRIVHEFEDYFRGNMVYATPIDSNGQIVDMGEKGLGIYLLKKDLIK